MIFLGIYLHIQDSFGGLSLSNDVLRSYMICPIPTLALNEGKRWGRHQSTCGRITRQHVNIHEKLGWTIYNKYVKSYYILLVFNLQLLVFVGRPVALEAYLLCLCVRYVRLDNSELKLKKKSKIKS